MGKYASQVVKQAQSWVGKKESDGSFKEIIDVYNSHRPLARGYKVKYTDEWCSTFVSAVAIKLGYTDIIPTECGCEKHTILFKNIGAWVENENRVPKAGDIIFYDWQDNGKGDNKGNADHIGIVEKVSGNNITVIEGNYNCSVARRTIKVNAKYIRGYGVPKYDAEKVETPNDKPTSTTKYKVGDTVQYNKIYSSSTSTKALNPLKTRGKITKIYEGARNPYLIDDVVGFINDNCINEVTEIKAGNRVRVLRAIQYNGQPFAVYHTYYDVIEVSGDRVVIGKGKAVTCAINKNNIQKL